MDEQTTGLNPESVSTEETTDSTPDTGLHWFVNPDGSDVTPVTGAETAESADSQDGDTTDVPATDTEPENADETNPQSGDATENVPSPRILRYQDNHTEQEFNVDSATDAEIIEKLQKANQYDRLKNLQAEHADAEKFRSFVQEKMKLFMDDYGAEGAKSMAVAGAMADGLKVYPISVSEDGTVSLTKNYLTIPDTEPAEAKPAVPTVEPTKPTLDTELKKLRAAFPEMTEIPKGAIELAAHGGLTLFEAVLLTQIRDTKQQAAATAKENRTLRQNAEAARKAPVRGVSGGGNPPKAPDDDPFLLGLRGERRIRNN